LVIGKYAEVFRGDFLVFGGGWGVGCYVGRSFIGGRDIAMKGAPDFPALFKKNSEIK
jgi:hypothetical protein